MDVLTPHYAKELELISDPHNFTLWWDYYTSSTDQTHQVFILDRAVQYFPRSYKLWAAYLDLRVEIASGAHPLVHRSLIERITALFERSLLWMQKYPYIWSRYIRFLLDKQPQLVSTIRKVFNRSLLSLPITQHHIIWPLFLQFADNIGGITASSIYLRFLQYESPIQLQTKENQFNVSILDIIFKLVDFGSLEPAIDLFRSILDQPQNFVNIGQSQHELWLEFCDLLLKTKLKESAFENLVYQGLEKFPDQISKFYLKLTKFYIKRRNFPKVRHLFRKGINSCVTVKDFTLLFDSYTEFEEALLTKLVEQQETEKENIEVSIRMNFLENLLEQRPILLNDLKLRQDSNNLDAWFQRVELYKDDTNKILNTFAQALTTINPLRAYSLSNNENYTLPKFWIQYARIYASGNDYKTASLIFQKSIQSQFADPKDLVALYIAWCELEMEAGNYSMAETIIKNACTIVPENDYKNIEYQDNSIDVHVRVHKSIDLWQFYIDLLQSFVDNGTEEEIGKVDDAFKKLIDLKIITTLDILNYASFLEEWKYYEKSFNVYEMGIKLFKFPIAFEIWNVYLTKAIQHNLNKERIRDLFEQCLYGVDIGRSCPPELCKSIFLLYAEFEKKNGLVLKSIKILKECIKRLGTSSLQGVEKMPIIQDKTEVYTRLLSTLAEINDTVLIRELYESILQDDDLVLEKSTMFTRKFIEFETSQREFTRVRALYKYILERLIDSHEPTTDLWNEWESFEISHGNETTFKAMLRFKRGFKDAQIYDEPQGFIKASEPIKNSNPDEIDIDM